MPEHIELVMQELPDQIDYNFHIKPILSDRCFACHGPDEQERKADLRLDNEEDALRALAGRNGKAIVRNHPMKSHVIKRMLSDDPEEKMPPPESHLSMSDRDIAMIAKWIDQGAEWKQHWSFIPPSKVEIPIAISDKWEQPNEIDHFIYKAIEEQNLQPNAQADAHRLLRRAAMDLTGLPPSVKQLNQLTQNLTIDAYENYIDQLLNSKAFGERMAMEWMDVSRYADSHGMHADGWRMMWPWRDWVISSFNDNMPYDEFVTAQIAGDLLPNPTKDQVLATAFNRNHTMTAEGGAIDEEFRLSYVFDRTETVSTAFLGMTIGCAKCHDHKYDPLSQKEYYEMTAFFNNVRELGMTGDDGNYGPMMLYTTEELDAKIVGQSDQIKMKEQELDQIDVDLSSIEKYVNGLKQGKEPEGLISHFPLDKESERKKDGRTFRIFDQNKNAVTYGAAKLEDGKYDRALYFTEDFSDLYIQNNGSFDMTDAFSVGLWVNTEQKDGSKTQTLIGNTGEKNNFWRGWDLYLDTLNRVSASLIHSKPHNMIHVTSKKSVSINEWNHIAMSYNGSGKANGIQLFINGQSVEYEINYDKLYKSIKPVTVAKHEPDDRGLRIGKSGRNYTGENGIFKGLLDDIKIFETNLTATEIASAAGLPPEFKPEDLQCIARRFDPISKKINKELQDLRIEKMQTVERIPEVMIMEDGPIDRKTYAYDRGEYLSPMYTVQAGTPSSILSFPDDLEKNRLGLTQWIFDKDNPLTARVAVNRYWQMIFGRGLVATPQDFGLQGANPSHPELLDHLALEFMSSGWDVKALIKNMVMSATYRQSSIATEQAIEQDPSNIYLARGASYRMPAEMIRDNALAASGLINEQVGGESVRPYQPEGLWIEKGNFSNMLLRYKETRGDSLYRRSLYTFVKRTSPHPMMTTFDAPSREVCTINRENTNTPLQSLVLMNDPQFVEAGKVLAQRMQFDGGNSLDEQLKFAFQAVTSRSPKPKELELFTSLYEDQYQRFKQKPKDAASLLNVGDFILDKSLDKIQTAALTMVSNTMLNHDEAYMKR